MKKEREREREINFNLLNFCSSASVLIKNAGKIPMKQNTNELNKPTKKSDE